MVSVVTRGHGRLAKQRVSLTNLPPEVAMIVNDVPAAASEATAASASSAGGADGKWMKDETDFDTYQVRSPISMFTLNNPAAKI